MVYLIEAINLHIYKIGITRNIVSRFANLQGSSPVKLTLVTSWNVPDEFEGYLHGRFDNCRLHGEWFNLSKADVELLKSCSTIEDLIKKLELVERLENPFIDRDRTLEGIPF